MPTTQLNLPEILKLRIARLAARAGITPNAWMLDALAAQTELAERRQASTRHAVATAEQMGADCEVYAGDAVHDYLKQRVAGRIVKRPAPIRR